MTLTKEQLRDLMIEVGSTKAVYTVAGLAAEFTDEIWPLIEAELEESRQYGARRALWDASVSLSVISSKMWAADFCDRLLKYRDVKYPDSKIITLSDGAVIRYVKGRKDCGTGDKMYLAEWSRDDWAPTDNWLELLHDTNTGEDFEKLKKFATEILQS